MADLTKDTIKELLREILPVVVEEAFGMGIPQLVERVEMNSGVARNSALARLGALLGLQGKELVEASQKLLDHYNTLPETEQASFDDDSKVIDLWGSITAQAPATVPSDTASGGAEDSKIDPATGEPILTLAKVSEMLEADPIAAFSNPDLIAAYTAGRVERE